MSWIPPPPESDPTLLQAELWHPPLLEGIEPTNFLYAVLEEQSGGIVELDITLWPVVDRLGRVRFPSDDFDRSFHVESEMFHQFVSAARSYWFAMRPRIAATPAAPDRPPREQVRQDTFAARPLHVGDVFALRPVAPESAMRLVENLLPSKAARLDWLRELYRGDAPIPDDGLPPLFDITRDGREAAKTAANAAVAPPIQASELDELEQEMGGG